MKKTVFILTFLTCFNLYALTLRWCDPTLVNNASGKDTGAEIKIHITDADGKLVRDYSIYNGQALTTIDKDHKSPYTVTLTSSRTGSVNYSFKADAKAQLFVVPCESAKDTGKLAYYIYGTVGPKNENSDNQDYLDAGAWFCDSDWVKYKTPYKKYLSATSNADCYYCPNSTHDNKDCPTYSQDPTKITPAAKEYNHCKTYT